MPFSNLSARHEALKKRIHSFKIPLSKPWINVMKVVYFSIPIIAGVIIMDKANKQAVENLEQAGVLRQGGSVETKQQNEALAALLKRHQSDKNRSQDS
jgi:hypothetical protein